jgi:hypothetical protein
MEVLISSTLVLSKATDRAKNVPGTKDCAIYLILMIFLGQAKHEVAILK